MTNARMKAETQAPFNHLKAFLEELFSAYCAHAFGFINANEVQIGRDGHAVALVRSVDKKNWYHVSNDVVILIENLRDMIYAYRTEWLMSYQLSQVGQHEIYTVLWDRARRVYH
ncbi:hypothetical protein SNEBB_007571 [Seison nebaliae]|nr:hypothetical protein SNEBB_007571 [Seison nebaliae]